MKKTEIFGVVFWCTAVLLIIVAFIAIHHVKQKGPDELLEEMKEGDIFGMYDLYGHGWENMVVMNHASEAEKLYGYDMAPLISKYRELHDEDFELDESHSVIALIKYNSYGREIGEVIACGDIVNVLVYESDAEDTVIFTKNIAASRDAEVFLLEEWESRFRIEYADGRKYAVCTK